jgi:hypothetical protein
MSDVKDQKKVPATKVDPKDYTLELPMIELGEAIKFVTDIHEKALETATIAVVAEKLDYAGASSTPFYRRLVAARLFHLLTPTGAALTPQALDYLKPTTAEAKGVALRNAIMGVPLYAELVQTHQGKRLNSEIIANGIVRKIIITQAGGNNCARVFIESLKFAEFLETDGTLKRLDAAPATEAPTAAPLTPDEKLAQSVGSGKVPKEFSDQEEHYLFLDKDKTRKATFNCPLFISKAEYDRICNWIEATWIVEEVAKKEST